MAPDLALTEAALTFIRHAAHDIPSTRTTANPRFGRMLTNAAGHSANPRDWLREAALLRLVSLAEAYVDAVSMHRMGTVVDQPTTLFSMMLEDFELTTSSTWQSRHEVYERYHGFSLRSRNGWAGVSAGVEVRNCLMHGMGNLTAKQRRQTKLVAMVRELDVSIGANRMHLTPRTIPKLADNTEKFVRHIDESISLARE